MLVKQINYTHLRQNLASILDEVIDDCSCVIVSRTGKEDVAIIAASELSNMMETLHLLKSPANAKRLFAAMERADELEGIKMESQDLAELCEELNDIKEAKEEYKRGETLTMEEVFNSNE